jgi:antitoxin FitA
MASITVRNLDDEVKKRLRKQAAEHGHSLEAEARRILREATELPTARRFKTADDLYEEIRALVEPLGGIELVIPPRTPMRALPDLAGAKRSRRARTG